MMQWISMRSFPSPGASFLALHNHKFAFVVMRAFEAEKFVVTHMTRGGFFKNAQE